jgi:Domain of unknown function (DUF1844)
VSTPDQPKDCGSETMSFATFTLSLFTAGLQQLGVQANEPGVASTAAPSIDLCLARQTIDLLEMLEHKTKGNLTPDETKLLTNILFDLRMHYVQAAKGGKP